MNDIDNNLSIKYAQLQEDLIKFGVFEELDDESFLENLSYFQDSLTKTGASQESIDTVVEAIWLFWKLGVRNLDNAPQLRAAIEELKG